MESGDVARCASRKNRRKKIPVYWPSVPLCVPFSCTELQYLQITTVGGRGGVTPGNSRNVSLQSYHMKTHQEAFFLGWGGQVAVSHTMLKYSSVIK